MDSPLAIGTIVLGRYSIEAAIGRGGMAEVYRARDRISGHAVAIKALHRRFVNSEEAVQRFEQEVKIMAEISHPHIVRFVESGRAEDGAVVLVMEELTGETLAARLHKGPLSRSEAGKLLLDIASALSALHEQKIIHRDLKPENVFLASGGPELNARLLDFGISKVLDRERLTRTGEVLGTPRCMAPEQLRAEPTIGPATDVYSLGMIVSESLLGRSLVAELSPSELIVAIVHGKLPRPSSILPSEYADVAEVLDRATCFRSGERFSSTQEFVAAWRAASPIASRDSSPRRFATTAREFSAHQTSAPQTGDAGPQDAQALATMADHHYGTKSKPLKPYSSAQSSAQPITLSQSPSESDALRREVQQFREQRAQTGISSRSVDHYDDEDLAADRELFARASGSKTAMRLGIGLCILGVILILGVFAYSSKQVPVADRANADSLRSDAAVDGGIVSPQAALILAAEAVVDASIDAGSNEPTKMVINIGESTREQDAPHASNGRERNGQQQIENGSPVEVPARAEDGPSLADVTPQSPLQRAASALRSRQYPACVTAATEALDAGILVALRHRGECQLRQGHNAEGIADLQRFCRLAPDHPAISEVQRILSESGSTCP